MDTNDKKIQAMFQEIKNECVVIDIETSSFYPSGEEISISADFENYVKHADVRWIGVYSFRTQQTYLYNHTESFAEAMNIIASHKFLVGFNIEDFDLPIMINNEIIDEKDKHITIDCMTILGKASFVNKKGIPYKNRGVLMDHDFPNNKLRTMAEVMGLECQKGEIDYKVFQKYTWTDAEIKEITTYLNGDIHVTKQMFEKLWDYWIPFTKLLSDKYIKDLSWIRGSIASMTYKAACEIMDVEPTYAEKTESLSEMGGHVVNPVVEEARGVFYVDFASLYPHIMAMCNLFSEVDPSVNGKYIWQGNDVFKVKGKYDISHPHKLSSIVTEFLKKRMDLKANDPKNPLVYTYKIFLNCFSSETRILLANNTTKYIKDCNVGEEVWSINPDTLNAEKKMITNVFEYDYNGDMHHYTGNYFDFCVTPNHRFLLEHKNNKNDRKFYESHEIGSQFKLPIHNKIRTSVRKNINILDFFPKEYFLYSIKSKCQHGRVFLNKYDLENKHSGYNCNDRSFLFTYDQIKNEYDKIINDKSLSIKLFKNGRRNEHAKQILYPVKELSYLIGIYLAEGSTHKSDKKSYVNGNERGETYSINLSQDKNINSDIYNKIDTCLTVCGLKHSLGKHVLHVSGSIFYDFIVNNFGKLHYKHFINKSLLDQLDLEYVFKGLIDGDGSKKSNLYTTKYDCLKNDFIELCMRLGYTFTVRNDGCWRIVYNNSKNAFRKESRTVESYNGKVYCVEVADNNTLMAGLNEKYNWSGNSLYGVVRSAIFEKVYKPNAGYDTCWLGQQFQQLVIEKMLSYGFKTIYGDTDSCMLVAFDEKHNNEKYMRECIKKIVDYIFLNVPFPIETFGIAIEHHIDYIMFPFEDQAVVGEDGKNLKIKNRLVKERKGKKKNYLYIYTKKDGTKEVVIKGLPIKKNNATKLGIAIFNDVLESKIVEKMSAKFTKQEIDNLINEYLQKPNAMDYISVEYKVKALKYYKKDNQIQAQISRAYFNGGDGVIRLIKNTKVGKCGQGTKYCSVNEAIENKLTVDDLDLDKAWQELSPFISDKDTV